MMHKRDYEALAAAVRAGMDGADHETRPGGLLHGVTADQVARVVAILAAEIAGELADRNHTFNPDAWLSDCGLLAEVTAMRPAPVRQYGAPLAFDDARAGDWICYAFRPEHPIIGRVWSITDKAVRTQDDYAPRSGESWPEGNRLWRARWSRLHVTLFDPAEVTHIEPEPRIHPHAERPPQLPRFQATLRALEAARAYLREHGHLRVPAKHVQDGYRLGGWIASQRYDYRHGVLSPDRLRALDALDVSWRHGCEWGDRR